MPTKTTILGSVPQFRGKYTEQDASNRWYRNNLVEYKGSTFICTVAESASIKGAPATYDEVTRSLIPNDGWEFFVDASSVLRTDELAITLQEGYYNCRTIGQPAPFVNNPGYTCAVYLSNPGMTFLIAGQGTKGEAQLFFTLDKDKKVVRNAVSEGIEDSRIETPISITLEEGEYYIGYNSGKVYSFNKFSAPLKYLSSSLTNTIYELKEEIKTLGDTDTTVINKGEYIVGRYLYINGLPSGTSDYYSCTDFISVMPGRRVRITNFKPADGAEVHFYDSAKVCIGNIPSFDPKANDIAVRDISIPSQAAYLRYSILNSQANINTIQYIDEVSRHYLADTLAQKLQDASHGKVGDLFAKAASRPLITVIDDDTPSSAGVQRMVDLCNEVGIKCTFATLTRQFEMDDTLADTMKSIERQGFQTVLHGYTQNEYYADTAERNDIACEEDFVHGLQDLIANGNVDPYYWVTPFGAQRQFLQDLARKWSMKCLITITGGIEDTRASNGKWAIRRCGLNAQDTGGVTFNQLKEYIDDCAANNKWLLIGTHIANGWEGDNYGRFREIVEYAKNKGCVFTTLGEAWNERKPIYDFYDMH